MSGEIGSVGSEEFGVGQGRSEGGAKGANAHAKRGKCLFQNFTIKNYFDPFK